MLILFSIYSTERAKWFAKKRESQLQSIQVKTNGKLKNCSNYYFVAGYIKEKAAKKRATQHVHNYCLIACEWSN